MEIYLVIPKEHLSSRKYSYYLYNTMVFNVRDLKRVTDKWELNLVMNPESKIVPFSSIIPYLQSNPVEIFFEPNEFSDNIIYTWGTSNNSALNILMLDAQPGDTLYKRKYYYRKIGYLPMIPNVTVLNPTINYHVLPSISLTPFDKDIAVSLALYSDLPFDTLASNVPVSISTV